jgi:hypothetical protein
LFKYFSNALEYFKGGIGICIEGGWYAISTPFSLQPEVCLQLGAKTTINLLVFSLHSTLSYQFQLTSRKLEAI